MSTKEDWLVEAEVVRMKRDQVAAWLKFGAFVLLVLAVTSAVIGFTLSINTVVSG